MVFWAYSTHGKGKESGNKAQFDNHHPHYQRHSWTLIQCCCCAGSRPGTAIDLPFESSSSRIAYTRVLLTSPRGGGASADEALSNGPGTTESRDIMTSTTLRATEHPGYDNDSFTTRPVMTSHACTYAICIFYAVANVIIIILGVTGNGLVIWITGFKVKKTVNSTWYLSLAVSDFLFCSFLPFIVVLVIKNEWIFGLFMCKVKVFILFLNWFCSVFLLVIISVDRCVVVMFPVWAQNHRTVRKASLIVVLAWISSAALIMPVLNLPNYIEEHCVYVYTNSHQLVAETTCLLIFLFVIPYLIILICYVIIMRKLKSNQTARSKKPFKIMTVLIITFLICWLPFHIFSMMNLNYQKYASFFYTAFTIAVTLANANSCLNPFLYAFMGKDVKEQCYTLLSKIENAVGEEGPDKDQRTTTTTSGWSNLCSSCSRWHLVRAHITSFYKVSNEVVIQYMDHGSYDTSGSSMSSRRRSERNCSQLCSGRDDMRGHSACAGGAAEPHFGKVRICHMGGQFLIHLTPSLSP
ncbi:chemokine-like receptor 1 [Colossoma macropomum]|uniref:chemokine-like receptor 1 n=1 Tax=Colossoma macropomum TaxID=42526 RepID=UPI0018643568|nr:chemokine-like receptor 1 [Colossoma macropomum]